VRLFNSCGADVPARFAFDGRKNQLLQRLRRRPFCEAELARVELVPFPVWLAARVFKHARLRLAGRTKASVPTQSISHRAYFFSLLRARDGNRGVELQDAIF
jgi:hypothetical protein